MYLQFYSVKEPSKNHDIWVWVLFGSLQNLGSVSLHSVWVCILSHLCLLLYDSYSESYSLLHVTCLYWRNSRA